MKAFQAPGKASRPLERTFHLKGLSYEIDFENVDEN
jgi:hypothetical protein